ncbi:peptidase S8 and S53 subtilisin kexin sedolisin [Haloarcula taiwanensis]|uniref:Peptidase S8 and S53 subtilisin kexin sedolisin n=1 Tax=Haloarcula taiwanensis TaxID=1932004 RepID=A0A2H4ZW10_9EURY|nr:peptidase S8 and S53 subtilisin kexin sedolisin [Haloarcula taiwanensis]
MSRHTLPKPSRRSVIKMLGSAVTVAAFGGEASASQNSDTKEYLIGVSNDKNASDVHSKIKERSDLEQLDIIDVNESLSYLRSAVPQKFTEELLPTVEAIEGVKYTEFNHVREPIATIPNDPKFDSQYAPQLVNAPKAWDVTFGSKDVTIAVIDTGTDYTHPDLDGQFGNQKGRDFVDNDSDPAPQSAQHGTHVSGIAAGETNDETGIAGVSNSRLLSCRALGPNGGRTADIANAVEWATDQGADIINMSLGGGGYNQTMKNAVSYAWNQGVLLICAAGNHKDGDPPSQQDVSYPAAYEECVAVGAVDQNKSPTEFSNYGEKVDIAAPGNDVLSSVPGGDYAQFPGTSMASPAVAGVAALGLDRHEWPVSQTRQNLLDTAQPLSEDSQFVGVGLADAYNFVTAGGGSKNEPPIVTLNDDSRTVTVNREIIFDASGSRDPDGSITNYRWEFGDGSDPVEGSDAAEVSHTYTDTGDYTVTVTVTDNDGAEATTSVNVSVSSEAKDRITTDSSGSLSGMLDYDTYTYSLKTDSPLQLILSLNGPSDADFDLYVSFDGRIPTPNDYDRASYTQDSNEQIIIDDFSQVSEIGILVYVYSGRGDYTLSLEEIGKTSS